MKIVHLMVDYHPPNCYYLVMIHRLVTPKILAALQDTPVVTLVGARQTGKSTLTKWLASEKYSARYLTLDDAAVLAAATSNPHGFVDALEGPVILDEVQRAPDLFLAIKSSVDRNRKPGRFLLTGSANVLLLPRIADSLAGRMEILTLWPFSQRELEGKDGSVIDMLFANRLELRSPADKTGKVKLVERIIAGGFPEAVQRTEHGRRASWFGSFVTTILQRDIRELANIEGLTTLPRLLNLLATRIGSLLNFAELSNTASIPQTTLKRYMTLLETTYLTRLLPAWSSHFGKRLVKTPKLYLADTGLGAYLLGMNSSQLQANPTVFGHLLEAFVLAELVKQSGWSDTGCRLYHFRTHNGQEVDFVLERDDGAVVGVEVKSSASVDSGTFSGLKILSEACGAKFKRGIVLYTGREVVGFEKNMHAVPVETLWG